MGQVVVPLSDLAQRMPVVGKLKHGVFKGGRPQAIETWRLTTASEAFAETFAARYGGSVKPMTNANSPHTHEVISEATEIGIALVPGGFHQAYEQWRAGGCQRRCDGVTVEVLQTTGPDDVEYVSSPCICDRKQQMECDVKTRVTVVLPDLPFRGGVIYETSSANFAQESRGMIALIQQLQASGITRGVLRLEKRKSTGGRRFTVAALGVTESLDALASGRAGMASLGTAPEPEQAELSSGLASPEVASEAGAAGGVPVPADEEDIVDAEVVEDEPKQSKQRRAYQKGLHVVWGQMGLSYEDQIRPWMQATYDGRSLSQLTDDEVKKLLDALNRENGRGQENRARFKEAVEAAAAEKVDA